MTKGSWASDDQHNWLLAKLPEYLQARELRNTTACNSAIGFGTLSATLLQQLKQTLHEWEVYHDLYYDYVETFVDAEWEEYRSSVPQGVKPVKSWSQVKNDVVQKLYDIEDESVKNEIKAHHQLMWDSRHEDDLVEDERCGNKSYEKAIQKLPRSIASKINKFMELTGWHFTVLAGGPCPHCGGNMDTLILHFGTNKDGNNWEQSMGQEEFEKDVGNKFDDFLYKSFSKEDRDLRSLAMSSEQLSSTSGSDEQADSENRSSLSEEGGSDRDGSENERDPESPTNLNLPPVEYVTTSDGRQMSKYDATRDNNIAANQQFLSELGLESPPPHTKGKKQRRTPKTKKSCSSPNRLLILCCNCIFRATPGSPSINDHITNVSRISNLNNNTVNDAPSNMSDTGCDVIGTSSDRALSEQILEQNSTAENGCDNLNIKIGSVHTTTGNAREDIRPLPDYAQTYLDYLNMVSSDLRWKSLVIEWKHFKLKKPEILPFSTANRPAEVTWWIQHHHSPLIIPDIVVAEFGTTWMAWWNSIQPQWHLSTMEHLHSLCCVIMSLLWWVSAINQAPDDSAEKLWNAVKDVTWVFQQVDSLPVLVGAK
ncbi:hypothetical protein BDQ17DRAFT_1436844 [Cyathus striatus]|nr:hypothetical protein BDQ17DRAFT_1436844 [Cyathus striatus]